MYGSISFYFVLTGKDGVEGETPERPGFHFFGGSFEGFNFTSDLGICAIPPFLTVDYEIEGKNANVPSKGGDGGCGGIGGHQGNTLVVNLKNSTQLSIINQKGRLRESYDSIKKNLINLF